MLLIFRCAPELTHSLKPALEATVTENGFVKVATGKGDDHFAVQTTNANVQELVIDLLTERFGFTSEEITKAQSEGEHCKTLVSFLTPST